MKILREGDRGTALAPGRGRVEIVYRYRPVVLEQTGVTVEGVLVGVDVETDDIVTIPAQSTPKLKAAREARKDAVLSVRMPRELEDVLNLVAEYYGTDPEQFTPAVIRFYLARAATDEGTARRLGRLAKSDLATGELRQNLRLRLRRDLHARLGEIAETVEGVNKSELVRGAILAAKEDVLEGRARRRRKELEAVALAV